MVGHPPVRKDPSISTEKCGQDGRLHGGRIPPLFLRLYSRCSLTGLILSRKWCVVNIRRRWGKPPPADTVRPFLDVTPVALGT